MDQNDIIRSLFTIAISSLVTFAGYRYTFKGKKVEAHSSVEGIYVENMQKIIDAYQNDINNLKNDMSTLRAEMAEMKASHEKELQDLRKENDDLRNKLRDAKAEIKYLEEKLNEN